MPKLGGERGAVQNPLIQYAHETGWDYVSCEDALKMRGGVGKLIFRDVFIERLSALNSSFIDEGMIDDLLKRLERVSSDKEGNLSVWEFLRGCWNVFVGKENRERNVRFFAERLEDNVFQVTDEFSFFNGRDGVRFDVVFLINGFPVFFVETKAAHKVEGIAEALDQIRRYHVNAPEALSMFQVYALTHLIHFYYSGTWNASLKFLYNWKNQCPARNFEGLVKGFFDRQAVIKTITDYILFTRQDDELTKVVLRPHQMRAVEKIVERASDKKKKAGLIWHTQGSGKTYTMIVAAKKIIENPLFENPTVLMLVDRNELETQLFGNLASVDFEDVEVALSKKHLKELLSTGRKGLIVSMIHKFENMPAKINESSNLFVLVDEAHRTTGGDLGNYLLGALPNATYIGFTGTPIDRTLYGKGTFKVFGRDDPPKGYLDRYGIAESIEDKTTVKLYYSLAPNDLLPERKVLEDEFLNLAAAEGVSDIEVLNRVLDKAVNLKNMLKNKNRMQKIAEYVANHYKKVVEPMGYKAFLVGVDREACALYKKELDKYLPEEYSKVVYSPAQDDVPLLKGYYLSDEEEKQIRKDFRKPDKLPKILIVTEKLLTGFDAPILYCMYLDKPMRDHVLLQAIARVNRPYEELGSKKTAGFVLDFVGIFDKLEKALAFDSGDITGVIKDIEILKGRFAELMSQARKDYLTIIAGKKKDKAVEALLEYFMDEEKRHGFYKFFIELSDIYEIVSPDAFLRPYMEDYGTLVTMYKTLKANFEYSTIIDREFTRKTAKLVREHTQGGSIEPTDDVYELDEKTIRKIEESGASDIEKVFNLIRRIKSLASEQGLKKPYLRSIGEKAELISALYKQRQEDTKEALEDLKKLLEEINSAEKERVAKGMNNDVFSIYWVLKDEKIDESEEVANRMAAVLNEYPYWRHSEEQEREIKKELYKLFGKKVSTTKAVKTVTKLIKFLKGI